jgi:hypothetical protein
MQMQFDTIAQKYQTSPGKVHITDLAHAQQGQLRKEMFDLIEQLQLPCFFEATHVAGFHAYFRLVQAMVNRGMAQRGSPIKLSAKGAQPDSLHEALFFGLYSKLLAFCLERGKTLLHIEVRTDQVDAPIFKNFQAAAKSLLEYGAKIQTVTGYDPDTKKVVKGAVETPAVPPALQLPITITQLDFKRINTFDGLVLAADVLANSLAYHYRMRGKKERYRRLNKPDALEGHPLFRSSLDAFTNWGSFDVSDTLYAHPCDPDFIRRMPFWKRPLRYIRCFFRSLKLRFSRRHGKGLDPMIAGPEGGPSSDMQRFED